MKQKKNSNSKILSVVRSDIQHLSKSIVALVCVFALALVPCLYSWFNILSNWNPYTPDSTKNLKIAFTTADEGTTFFGMHFNIGDVIVERLEGNNQIDWQFPATEEELMDGLYAGEYYAGLLCPSDFSDKLLGFTTGDFEDAKIIYYDNQKMNAVASRVTDRAKALIENEINAIFVATIVDKLSAITSVFTGVGVTASESLGELDEQFDNIRTDLRAFMSIMDSLSSVTESAALVASMTGDLLPDMAEMLANSRSSISDMKERLNTSKQDVVVAADAIRTSSEKLRNTIERVDKTLDGDAAGAGGAYVDWDSLYGEGGINEYEGEILDDLYYDINKQLHESVIRFDDILQQTSIDTNLIASMSTLQKSLDNLDALLERLQGNIGGSQTTIDNYAATIQAANTSIVNTKEVITYVLDMVNNMQSNINDLRSSESFTKILDLMNTDVTGLVEYLSSPATIEVSRVYAIENNGSGMAAFYTILSLYASALLSSSMLATHVKRKEEMGLSNFQAYVGRYILFFLIGQATALLTVLGNLYYIGIQCYSPFMLWAGAAVASMLFTLINYGLVYAFDNLGEAFSIVFLCMQVAGTGGTYPVQMLPNFFQKIYNFTPFKYALTAFRETIGGYYDHVYAKCMLVMLGMAVFFFLFGFFGGRIFAPIRKLFSRGKEKTGMMHSG